MLAAALAVGCGQSPQMTARVAPVAAVTAPQAVADGALPLDDRAETPGRSYELMKQGGGKKPGGAGGGKGRADGGGKGKAGGGGKGKHGGGDKAKPGGSDDRIGSGGRHDGGGGKAKPGGDDDRIGGGGRHDGDGGGKRHDGRHGHGGDAGQWGGGNWWVGRAVLAWWGYGAVLPWWGLVPLTQGRLIAVGAYYFPFYLVGNRVFPDYSMPYLWDGTTYVPVAGAPPLLANGGRPIDVEDAELVEAPLDLF